MKKLLHLLSLVFISYSICGAQIMVSDIASLRAGTQGQDYTITGEVILTFQQSFRGQKYIQDVTAGILIDDNDEIITSSYDINDGITGITGTLSEFGGMLQFVPLMDPGAASSTGNSIDPQEITLADLSSNFEEYEAELVLIKEVSFADEGSVFAVGTVYGITDSSGPYNFRTTFYDADYIAGIVPETADIICLPNSRNDGEYITARSSDDIDADIIGPTITDVANISELRAGTIGQFYRLTGEAVLTFQQSFRNQKFIQDETAGILIDDNPGNVTSSYSVYDGITGIVGSLGEFGGMLQFAPSEDPGPASSSGNMITPQEVQLQDLIEDFEAYESELCLINNLGFSDAGGSFENGTVYGVADDVGIGYNFRTTFWDVGYIGGSIPEMANVVVIPNSRNDGDYITARDVADISEISSTQTVDWPELSVQPNPVRDILTISGMELDNVVNIQILDATGRTVLALEETRVSTDQFLLDLGFLESGVYHLLIKSVDSSEVKATQIVKTKS